MLSRFALIFLASTALVAATQTADANAASLNIPDPIGHISQTKSNTVIPPARVIVLDVHALYERYLGDGAEANAESRQALNRQIASVSQDAMHEYGANVVLNASELMPDGAVSAADVTHRYAQLLDKIIAPARSAIAIPGRLSSPKPVAAQRIIVIGPRQLKERLDPEESASRLDDLLPGIVHQLRVASSADIALNRDNVLLSTVNVDRSTAALALFRGQPANQVTSVTGPRLMVLNREQILGITKAGASIEAQVQSYLKAQPEIGEQGDLSTLAEEKDRKDRALVGVQAARTQMEQVLGPILLKILQAHQADMLLDRYAVVAADFDMDLTTEAIQKLDIAMPDVKVVVGGVAQP